MAAIAKAGIEPLQVGAHDANIRVESLATAFPGTTFQYRARV